MAKPACALRGGPQTNRPRQSDLLEEIRYMPARRPFKHSFAVGSAHGPRSGSWIVTIEGHDIYVTCALFRRLYKFSLHESGQWHLKSFEKGRWSKPQLVSPLPGATTDTTSAGLCILIPDDCLRAASLPDKQHHVDTWLDRPEKDGFVELVVGRVADQSQWDDVPKMQKLGFELKITDMLDGWYGYIAYRALRASEQGAIDYRRLVDWIRPQLPKPIALNSRERRMLVPARTTQGHLCVVEVAID